MADAKAAPKKTLVLFCHPNYAHSKHSKTLWEALKDAKLENVTLRNVGDLYGNNEAIDIAAEQALWEAHDNIVLQFPTNWSGFPWLLKKYVDQVLAMGWYYGNGGYKVQGKTLAIATTTFGTAEMWRVGGFYGFTIDECFRHVQGIANFGKMKYLTPFTVHGCWNGISDADLQAAATKYVDWVKKLQ
jgi:glutathione-regulated potassium-efflux system ancillary protein KefG